MIAEPTIVGTGDASSVGSSESVVSGCGDLNNSTGCIACSTGTTACRGLSLSREVFVGRKSSVIRRAIFRQISTGNGKLCVHVFRLHSIEQRAFFLRAKIGVNPHFS